MTRSSATAGATVGVQLEMKPLNGNGIDMHEA
jgi:hypothetical protein